MSVYKAEWKNPSGKVIDVAYVEADDDLDARVAALFLANDDPDYPIPAADRSGPFITLSETNPL